MIQRSLKDRYTQKLKLSHFQLFVVHKTLLELHGIMLDEQHWAISCFISWVDVLNLKKKVSGNVSLTTKVQFPSTRTRVDNNKMLAFGSFFSCAHCVPWIPRAHILFLFFFFLGSETFLALLPSSYLVVRLHHLSMHCSVFRSWQHSRSTGDNESFFGL